jgi:maleylacetate reductase
MSRLPTEHARWPDVAWMRWTWRSYARPNIGWPAVRSTQHADYLMIREPDSDELRPSPLVVTRGGSIEDLPRIVETLNLRAPLLVVGHGNAALAQQIKLMLPDGVIGAFNDAVAHVPAWQANLAVACAQEVHSGSVVAVGGGSAAGYAKVIGVALGLPWIAVPTTLSGAEMTSRYFVTTEGGKESRCSRRAAASAVIYDPDLLEGVPTHVLASSGMTAMGTCIEILAREQGGEARAAAAHGLNLLWHTLPRFVDGRADEQDRALAFAAALLAGTALESIGPGFGQLVAEELGAVGRGDHGALVAYLSPQVGRNVAAVRELAGPGEIPDLIREFVQRLGFAVELDDVFPNLDLATLATRLVSRQDLPEAIGLETLRSLLWAA